MRNGWKKGGFLIIDSESGMTRYSGQVKRDYTGERVTKRFADYEQPQDFVRPCDDPRPIPFANPGVQDFNVDDCASPLVGETQVVTQPSPATHLYDQCDFLPSEFDNLVRWYDFNDPAGTGVQPADGSEILTLVDKSGHSNATGTTGTVPLFGANLINSHGCGVFTNNRRLTMGSSLSLTGEFTIFIVARTTNGNKIQMFLGTGSNTITNKIGIGLSSTMFVRILNGGSSSIILKYPSATNIFTLQRDNVNKVYACYGASQFNTLYSGVAQSGTSTFSTIGIDDITSSDDLEGNIAEIIIYSEALLTSQCGLIWNYLNDKWGT